MKTKIQEYLTLLNATLKEVNIDTIEKIANLFISARNSNKQIFVFGNGGSGSTASHMVCDIIKGCSYNKERKFRIICLNDNIPTILAYSNDVNFDCIFIEQLKNLMNEGDIVLGISGSGNSKNVINAIQYANENNAISIGFTGLSGGKLLKQASTCLHIPINDMQITEDFHFIVMHILYRILVQS